MMVLEGATPSIAAPVRHAMMAATIQEMTFVTDMEAAPVLFTHVLQGNAK